MIKLEYTEVRGWTHAVRGMRNPMSSWEKSDSQYMLQDTNPHDLDVRSLKMVYDIGPNDLELMKKLRAAGTDHRKYLRMITVYVDITAPLYWWKEFDTYKVGTVANSCSTMHKIAEKEFTEKDFSCEHLIDCYSSEPLCKNGDDCLWPYGILVFTVDMLNACRAKYLETNDKKYWWQMIQLLPSSYNQRRTVMLNYEVLANIYKSRKNHKLDEWREGFCGWIKSLPYAELITGEES